MGLGGQGIKPFIFAASQEVPTALLVTASPLSIMSVPLSLSHTHTHTHTHTNTHTHTRTGTQSVLSSEECDGDTLTGQQGILTHNQIPQPCVSVCVCVCHSK